ncbi:MAG: mitochondrial fission ELM1 family protein [Chromatiales bacterium]|nr:mitochondrial fission ELM1 family protein [Chromatiales bacterium]
MKPLRVLLLADDHPGHFHIAEGVVAALGKIAPVHLQRIEVRRRSSVPARALGWIAPRAPAASLRIAYHLGERPARPVDLIVSAGGNTTGANVALHRLLGAPNVFCGTVRHFSPADFSLIVTPYRRFAPLQNHLLAPKIGPLDADRLGRPLVVDRFGRENLPQRLGLLIGGDSGRFRYAGFDWQRLLKLVRELHRTWGCRWWISTSRRTPDSVADALATMAREEDCIERLIDYRFAGSGTLAELYAAVDAAICTADSSSMLSEAIGVRLPVITVTPDTASYKADEAEYREYLTEQGWFRNVPLLRATPEALADAFATISPLALSPLQQLAEQLAQRLAPLGLFVAGGPPGQRTGHSATRY